MGQRAHAPAVYGGVRRLSHERDPVAVVQQRCTGAPVSWLVARHVQEGRERFNVSEWSGLNEGGEEAAETVMRRSMPTWDYMLMHPAARLSASETKELVTGLVATFGG